jgi:hypothetical protein
MLKSLKSPLSACRYSSSCVKSLPFFTSRIQVSVPGGLAQNFDIRHILLGEQTALVCLGLLFLRVVKSLSFLLVFHRRPVRLRRFGRTRRLQDSEMRLQKARSGFLYTPAERSRLPPASQFSRKQSKNGPYVMLGFILL